MIADLMLSDLATLVRSLEPELHDGVYVYCSVPADHDLSGLTLVAMMREREGLTLVVAEAEAIRAGLPVVFRAAWITLTVHSDLQAIGLTAAFATALGTAGISCNVIAGAFHDHIFVPADRGAAALDALRQLQRAADQAS
ncbi:MAG: ACT domain-containing protein [Kofleriaceae bacterium]